MLLSRISENYFKYLLITLLFLTSSNKLFAQNNRNNDFSIEESWSYEKNINAFQLEIKRANDKNDTENLTYLYSEIAAILFGKRHYKQSLENYILAYQYSDKIKDEYNYYSILYGMALIKQQLQEYQESKDLLIECKKYFEHNLNDINFKKGYVNTVGRLSYLNFLQNNIDSAKFYNQLEYKNKVDSIDVYFALKNNGLIEHHLKNYIYSIQLLKKSQKHIKNDISWNMIINQYIGENYYYLGEIETAKTYYEKVVQMYLKEKILSNEIRLSFERLIEYYKTNGDQKQQLIYIDYLLDFDKEFNEANKFLAKSYYQDYETKNLLEEKNSIIQHIKYKNTINIIAIAIVFVAVCGTFYAYYSKQNKKLKTSLDELDNYINTNKKERKPRKTTYKKPVHIPINTELEDKIIDFENEKGFLNPNITLETLAKDLKTNRTTLSQHINQSRDKTFTNYINALRVNYLIELIVSDPKTKTYTMDTLAEMGGFNNRKTFSDSFIQVTGLRPSYFIKNTRHL